MTSRKITHIKIDEVPVLNLNDHLELDEALMRAEYYYKLQLENAERALINLADGKVNVRHQYGIYRSRIVRVLKGEDT